MGRETVAVILVTRNFRESSINGTIMHSYLCGIPLLFERAWGYSEIYSFKRELK